MRNVVVHKINDVDGIRIYKAIRRRDDKINRVIIKGKLILGLALCGLTVVSVLFYGQWQIALKERDILIKEVNELKEQTNKLNNFIDQLKGDNEKLVVSMAIYYKVDPYLAWYIAKCESGFNEKAKSKTSSATGLFQFIDSTWKAYCTGDRLNAVDNARCGIKLMAKGGWKHWECYNNLVAQR